MEHDHSQQLAPKAFEMFRDWTKNAKLHYPHLDFTIIDESVLVQDLLNSIRSAKKSLLTEEKAAKRSVQGYDEGFISGFIHSNLNLHWVNEYIRKQQQPYKEFIALKALKSFLAFDTLAAIRVKAMYEHLMKENANIDSLDLSLKKDQYTELSFIPDEAVGHQHAIFTALENYISRYVLATFKEEPLELLESINLYFSKQELKSIIDDSSF